jgi:hypothetical protein
MRIRRKQTPADNSESYSEHIAENTNRKQRRSIAANALFFDVPIKVVPVITF